MAKPLLLSAGQGKVQEFVGTSPGQVATWSETAGEWFAGPGVGGSGGGGVTYYLNENTAPESPTTNIPTGASGATVKELGTTSDSASTTVASTASVPVLPSSPELIAGFVTDVDVPGLLGIPAGLWEFNVWAEATGGTRNQTYLQARVYKYDGTNAPTLIAQSVETYLYDPSVVAQYTMSVLIPGGTTLLATDRIYVAVLGGSQTNNRQITVHFGNGEPSHVHTSIIVPVDLATDVTGTLPVANGGTGVTTLTGYVYGNGSSDFSASASIPLADVTGAAPLASPTFTGTPAAPTASSGDNTTQIATTAFVTTAVATSSGAPYDLPFEIPGTPATSTKVVNFEAVRAFILATTGHQGGQLTNPSGNFVCTVRKNATTLGTITFAAGGFSSNITATLTDRTFAAGDVLSVETPASALGIDTPFATFFMTLV